MPKPVDIELKKAFMELQEKMQDTSKKIKVIDTQVSTLKRVSSMGENTAAQLSRLDKSTVAYESVGRMFMLSDLEEVSKQLKNKEKLVNNRIKELENNKEYLEKSLKESEDNIREMVQQRKQK